MAGRPLPGLIAGATAAVPIAVLTAVMSVVPLQSIFIALSSDLFEMLTLGRGLAAGIGILIGGGAIAGLLGAGWRISPSVVRRAIGPGAIAVLIAGVFQELIQLMLQQYEGPVGEFRDFLYTWEGLSPQGADHDLHCRGDRQRSAGFHPSPACRAYRRARPPTRTHDLGRARLARSCTAAGSRRLLCRPGADAGRALHPDGHGAQPGGRPRRPARSGLRRLLRRRRLHHGAAHRRLRRTPWRTCPTGRRCRSPWSSPSWSACCSACRYSACAAIILPSRPWVWARSCASSCSRISPRRCSAVPRASCKSPSHDWGVSCSATPSRCSI